MPGAATEMEADQRVSVIAMRAYGGWAVASAVVGTGTNTSFFALVSTVYECSKEGLGGGE